MKVAFTNLFKLITDKKKIFYKINSLIKNANFVGGSEIKSFEKEFSNFLNIKYCIAVANGTDALEIAIKSLNFPKGSEIIMTGINIGDMIKIIEEHGLVPIPVDLDPYTMAPQLS